MSQLGSSLGVLPSSKSAFMPPKKNIIDYAKSKASKKAKKAEELPSADGGVSENEAWAAGSQQPTKGDLNNMYTAMQYEKTKHANIKPLETYRAMKSSKDKPTSGETSGQTRSSTGSRCRRATLAPALPRRVTLRGG
jgi:hypothetical protein